MSNDIFVQCKECSEQFETTKTRISYGRGKFCSRNCSARFHGRKHGHCTNTTVSRTYSTWSGMLSRCNNKKATKYYMYGGKGISVCDEWLDFSSFLKDMGERPDGKTLDRIDSSKGYYKENCRWATLIEQQNNLKSNVIVNYNGSIYNLTQLARIFEIHPMTLKYRIQQGWDESDWSKKPNRKSRVE